MITVEDEKPGSVWKIPLLRARASGPKFSPEIYDRSEQPKKIKGTIL